MIWSFGAYQCQISRSIILQIVQSYSLNSFKTEYIIWNYCGIIAIFVPNIQILYEFRSYNEAFCIILYAACVIDVISAETVFPFYW